MRFHRQYMQQIPNLTFPPSKLLLEPDVQDQMYRHFFDHSSKANPAYQRRVLKQIIALIERTMSDSDEDVILSRLPSASCTSRIIFEASNCSMMYLHRIDNDVLPATDFSL